MKSYVVFQIPNSILFVKRDFRPSFDEKGGKYSIILPSMKYSQCDARNPNHIRVVLNESLSHILVMFSKDYFGLQRPGGPGSLTTFQLYSMVHGASLYLESSYYVHVEDMSDR
jgi:hypothetical protein